MKTKLVISIAITLINLVALVVPIWAAPLYTDAPSIIFHVEDSENLTTIPEDAEGEIVFEGTYVSPATGNHFVAAYIQNLCEGIDCAAQDIYYRIEMSITWDGNGYFPNMDQAPVPQWLIGSASNLPPDGPDDNDHCGDLPGASGSCDILVEGMINAEDISTDPLVVQEAFILSYIGNHPAGVGYVTITNNYQVTLSTSPIAAEDCSSQWIPGNKFGTFTLAATDSVGQLINTFPGFPNPGEWVYVKVASGSWQNNVTGPDQTSLAVKTSLGDADWHPLAAYEMTACHDGTNTAYYMQVPYRGAIRLRVNDTDGNFSSNTGSLAIELYTATFSPFLSGCDASYEIGSLIEERSAPAVGTAGAAGIAMATGDDLIKGVWPVGGEWYKARYMMLETSKGPHFDGGVFTYAGEVKIADTWYEFDEIPGAVCTVQIDVMGNVRTYFPYSEDVTSWMFRAYDSDGDYSNNFGLAGYKLYYVDKLQIYIPGAPAMDCSSYAKGTAMDTVTLQAKSSSSHTLDLVGGQLYAIQTSNGPWYNDGEPIFSVAISDDGYTWDTTYTYPYTLCASAVDGSHSLMYFKALAGKTYRLRVDDPGGNFTDNSGTITATVYNATTTIQNWSVCIDDYIVHQLDIPEANRQIPATSYEGVGVSYIQSGNIYALTITRDHAWKTIPIIGKDLYTAQISDDGGATWQDFPTADFVTCAVRTGGEDEDNATYRIVFTANGNYKLRVDGGTIAVGYAANSGYLVYELGTVSADDVDVPDQPGDNIYIPPEWGSACYEVCNRPVSLIVWQSLSFGTLGAVNLPLPDVGGWVSYGTCSVQRYMTWCPEHTAALMSIKDIFSERDPFGTLLEIKDGFTVLQEQADILTTAGGEGAGQQYTPYSIIMDVGGGESGGGTAWEGLNPSVEGTPWTGEPLSFENVDTSMEGGGEGGYYNVCLPVAEPIIGDFNFIFCNTLTILKGTMTWMFTALQFLFDIACLILLYLYFKKRWIDPHTKG